MSYYAVAKGREVGIFPTWEICEKLVKGFKGAKYKKFKTKIQAEEFIKIHGGCTERNAPSKAPTPLGEKEVVIDLTKSDDEDDNYWPECDGDNFDLGDEDLLLALQNTENRKPTIWYSGNSNGNGGKGKKRKNEESGEAPQFKKLPKHKSKIWKPVGVEQIGAHLYPIDSEGFVICYTDGSCINNGRRNACAGFGVYFDDDHPLNAARPVKGRVTNNSGEIQAAIHAIKTAKSQGIKKICISTDSQFLINSITMWINAWKDRGWRLKNGDPVKNLADFKELDSLINDSDMMIKWNYVKGHRGIKGNEKADSLAKQGTEMYKRLHKIK